MFTARAREVFQTIEERERQVEVVFKLMKKMIDGVRMNMLGPKLGGILFKIVRTESGVDDPYYNFKIESNKLAERTLARMLREDTTVHRLLTWVTVANTIDPGPIEHKENVIKWSSIIDSTPLKGDVEYALSLIEKSRKILYLCDNSGEFIFDAYFILQLMKSGKEIICAVKAEPFQNDVTIRDVESIKIAENLKIISTGNSYAGVILEESSSPLLKALTESDLVIAKGMGNFESITEYINDGLWNHTTIFLLVVKCTPISKYVGYPVGSAICKVFP